MNDIRLLTFDLDNTLWDVDKVIVAAEAGMREWMQSNVPSSMAFYTSEYLPDFRAQVIEQFPSKRHDLSFMRVEVLKRVMQAAGFDVEQSAAHAQSAFEIFFEGRNRVEFFDHALDQLAQLTSRYPLLALTNGNADIERTGLSKYFSGAYSSADVGASKPSPEMFHAALEEYSLEPSQAIHIGDNLVDDIAGAQSVGMHTIWVNFKDVQKHNGDAEPTREISALDQLGTAVEAIVKA